MRAILLGALGALLVLVPVRVSAQELIVGNDYRESVKLTDAMGGVYLPLPRGTWKLVSLQREVAKGYGAIPTLNGRFVATDLDSDRRPRALIWFTVALEASQTGWRMPSYCGKKDLNYIEPKDGRGNRSGDRFRCWGVSAQTMKPAEDAQAFARDAYEWVNHNTRGMPLTAMKVSYFIGAGPKYLGAEYLFNPEAMRFKRLGTTSWNRDRIGATPRMEAYVDLLTRFGTRFAAAVDKGFAGKPLDSTDVALARENDPTDIKALPTWEQESRRNN